MRFRNKQKIFRFATYPVLLLSMLLGLLLASCVGFDPAVSHCANKGLKKATAGFDACVDKRRAQNRYLNKRYRSGGP